VNDASLVATEQHLVYLKVREHFMGWFSLGDAFSLRGRRLRWLGGWSGKPSHPSLTALVIGAYMFAAFFDVVSFLAGNQHSYSHSFYLAGTYLIRFGLFVSILTVITGLWDWWSIRPRGSHAWRMANTHMALMFLTTLFVFFDFAGRNDNETANHTSGSTLLLSLIVVVLLTFGGTVGGSLVYDHGVSVKRGEETRGSAPEPR